MATGKYLFDPIKDGKPLPIHSEGINAGEDDDDGAAVARSDEWMRQD